MDDIEKLAYDYLYNEPAQPRKKLRRTRAALTNAYERARASYVKYKKVVDEVVEAANILKKKYDENIVQMNEYHQKMLEIRQTLYSMDDAGKDFILRELAQEQLAEDAINQEALEDEESSSDDEENIYQ